MKEVQACERQFPWHKLASDGDKSQVSNYICTYGVHTFEHEKKNRFHSSQVAEMK